MWVRFVNATLDAEAVHGHCADVHETRRPFLVRRLHNVAYAQDVDVIGARRTICCRRQIKDYVAAPRQLDQALGVLHVTGDDLRASLVEMRTLVRRPAHGPHGHAIAQQAFDKRRAEKAVCPCDQCPTHLQSISMCRAVVNVL